MVELQEKLSAFEHTLAQLAQELPAERIAAFESYAAVGLPTSHDEEFRFTSLRELRDLPMVLASPVNLKSVDISCFGVPEIGGNRVVFVNGSFVSELSNLQTGPGASLSITTLELLGTTIATYKGKLGSTNDARFVDLNTALCGDVLLVQVANETSVADPIHVIFITQSDTPVQTHPRIRIEMGSNSSASIVETYIGNSSGYLTNSVAEIVLASGSKLEHVRHQAESRSSFHLGQVWVHQEEDSNYASTSVQFGGQVARVEINVWSNGEHTETNLDGAYVAGNSQTLDNRTRIDHAVPNCHSFEVYKGILSGDSHGVFNGKIFVYEDAQKTDAKQTNQALLLSPTATINTKPQLEIFADDVKCTHGATVGQLRPEQLFYLRSRGISAEAAKAMLVYAFAAEVIEKISIEALREFLESELLAKLQAET